MGRIGTRFGEGSTGYVDVPCSPPTDQTSAVLTDLVLERHRQIHLWGHNTDTPDGTGPGVRWLYPLADSRATTIEASLRGAYDAHCAAHGVGSLTWRHVLLEEMAEAFKEDDPDRLYEELVQVAAVAVSWCEKLRQRR